MPRPERPEYERPVLPFERKADRTAGAWQWASAGFEFGVAVVLFFLGGRWLDAILGTAPWLSVAGALLGVGAGTWLLLRPVLQADARPPEPGAQERPRSTPPGSEGGRRP